MANIKISQMTEDQKRALDLMLSGENVFLTGEAGTGKSEVVKLFIEMADQEGKNILITAPTGTAADNLHGETIHRCFGAKIGVQKNNRPLTERNKLLQAADIIIIDEISMCRFDLFEYVARRILFENESRDRDRMNRDLGYEPEDHEVKENDIQLIVLGDFYQLPPIIVPDDRLELSVYNFDYGEGFAFASKLWDLMRFNGVLLTEVVRQEDKAFKSILSEIRRGNQNSKSACIDFLMRNSCDFPLSDDNAITLVPTNKKCKEINDKKLSEITGVTERTYYADTEGDVRADEKFADDEIYLKEGCKVMITVNASDGEYVNGTMGIVKELHDNYVDILTENGRLVSIGKNTKEITKTVEVTKMVKKLVEEAVMETVIENGEEIKRPKTDESGNVIKEEVLREVPETTFKHEKVGSFTQIPVRVAYAITIHKSQGKTFEKVNLDPYAWDNGQFYTALSRGKKIENIFFMQTIRPAYIKTSSAVKAFMKPLEKARGVI